MRPRCPRLSSFGCYEKARYFINYARYLKRIAPKNVTFLHWIDDDMLKELYASSKGLIATSINEDFGLNAIEAMASGKPVIAPNEGGYKETVLHGITGVLLNEITPKALSSAIGEVQKKIINCKEESRKQALNYDTKVFIEKIKKRANSYI